MEHHVILPKIVKTIRRNLFHQNIHIFLLIEGGRGDGDLISVLTYKRGLLERGAYLRGG